MDKAVRVVARVATVVLLATTGVLAATPPAPAASPCDAPANKIVAENCLPGAPATQWDVEGSGDPSIQGFATQMSVEPGSTVHFKVDTDATSYGIDIYRLGYYGGDGARFIASVSPSVALPQTQPACLHDDPTGLVDCGNWAESASWNVPANAVSGVYVAKLHRTDATPGANHILFVVRDDAGHSDLVFQTSDTTWEAYNDYGGNSLYTGAPAGRAYKVSYNRPFVQRGGIPEDSPFNAEYPMIRWIEANGYDVSYTTGADTDRAAASLLTHKAFMSVGHDEYWSGAQRANVEAARDAGVNLAFFSGNEVFWKTRWENSIDGSNTPYRTLVSYKETHANAKIDPNPAWTGTWRDPRFSPPSDGGRPENGLTGTIFTVNCCTYAMQVGAADGAMRFWRNTSVAASPGGDTLPDGTLGYEWDEDLDNGARPDGLIRMSSTTQSVPQRLLDYGSNYGPGSATHALTLYKKGNALVFGAGTVQWSWGLDGTHDRGGSTPSTAMQQATVNLFADMGVQPGSLQPGLTAASASADTTAPTSALTTPAAGATPRAGTPLTVTGTAADTGGGVVGGVEVSTDNGTTWHRASGRESWTYTFTPGAPGAMTLRSRATDDSANIGTASAPVAINVLAAACPCSLWNNAATPTTDAANDGKPIEVGVKFTADRDGTISAIRFYKGASNTGTHVAHLWSSTGTLLATATFSSESASGWQEVALSPPVAVTAGTEYVASYFSPNGFFAYDPGYFATQYGSGPLHAPAGTSADPNGVFVYAASGFPTGGAAANYWVDVVLTTEPDTTPPVISAVGVAPDVTGVAPVTWTTDEASTSQVSYGTAPDALTSTASDPTLTTTHSVSLHGLTPGAKYYFRVSSADPSANTATSPNPPAAAASFTVPTFAHTDSTLADFGAGTLGACRPVAHAGVGETASDGEITLPATRTDDFGGGALPSGWESDTFGAGGSVSVAGGDLVLNGGRAKTTAFYTPVRSLEFVGEFGAAPFQHIGLADAFDQPPWAMFSTGSDGATLKARTADNNGSTVDEVIPGNYFGAPHRYRIDVTATHAIYSIDGTVVATHAANFTQNLRPAASDFDAAAPALTVDWLDLTPYTSPCTFESQVIDAGSTVDWNALTASATTPAGSAVTFETRTSADGVTWSSYAAAPGGVIASPDNRYIQYRATLTSSDPANAPSLASVRVAAIPIADATPPMTTMLVPANNSSLHGGTFLDASATDNVGVTGVEYRITGGTYNNVPIATGTNTIYGWLAIWNTASVPNGVYTVRSRAVDAVGNAAFSAPFTLHIDNTPPAVTLAAPANNSSVKGSILLGAVASDNVGVTKVELHATGGSLNNALIGTATNTVFGWLAGWNTDAVAQGTYAVRAVAFDAAGNTTTSAPITLRVDRTPPTTSVIIPSNDTTTLTGSTILDAAANDNVGVTKVEFRVTGPGVTNALIGTATATPYGWLVGWDTTARVNGTYTLRSIAFDAAGNSTTSAARTVKIQN